MQCATGRFPAVCGVLERGGRGAAGSAQLAGSPLLVEALDLFQGRQPSAVLVPHVEVDPAGVDVLVEVELAVLVGIGALEVLEVHALQLRRGVAAVAVGILPEELECQRFEVLAAVDEAVVVPVGLGDGLVDGRLAGLGQGSAGPSAGARQLCPKRLATPLLASLQGRTKSLFAAGLRWAASHLNSVRARSSIGRARDS